MNKEYVFVGTAQLKTRDYINQLEQENKDLQQKLDKILTYAKDRCDGYLEDIEYDCEYCDGVFASCRKVLQLAGEDISEYE
jgi:hypothetical protein